MSNTGKSNGKGVEHAMEIGVTLGFVGFRVSQNVN